MTEPKALISTDEEILKIRQEEEYRAAIRQELLNGITHQSPRSSVWTFINSSFGLWLLSAVFISGAGSLFTLYQNAVNERVRIDGIREAERKAIAEKVERLDLEIAYRLSATQSNLFAVSALHKTSNVRKDIRAAVKPLFSPANVKVQPLYPEFASCSGIALIAELRRHVASPNKQKLSKVITSLSGLSGELEDITEPQSADPTLVAGKIIDTMRLPGRWDLGFFYTDCSKDRPFC